MHFFAAAAAAAGVIPVVSTPDATTIATTTAVKPARAVAKEPYGKLPRFFGALLS